MTLASKLGKSYDAVKEQTKLKTITIELGAVKFDLKVRVPLKREMESMMEKIAKPEQALVEKIYNRLANPVRESVQEGGEDFLKAINEEKQTIVMTDDDILLDGQSVRQVATFAAMWETKVEEYFHLLQSETGEPVNESYEEIAEEFTEPVIRQIVEDIEAAIKPDYKTAKKN